jgi:hypothetical protein
MGYIEVKLKDCIKYWYELQWLQNYKMIETNYYVDSMYGPMGSLHMIIDYRNKRKFALSQPQLTLNQHLDISNFGDFGDAMLRLYFTDEFIDPHSLVDLGIMNV